MTGGHRGMVWFVRACAVYNLAGAAAFVVPGSLDGVGVEPPDSSLWLVMSAVFATFVAVVLLYATQDLEERGSLPFWNGIARLTFAVTALAAGYGTDVGTFVTYLAAGDLALALGAVTGIPLTLRRSPIDLLFNRRPPQGSAGSVDETV